MLRTPAQPGESLLAVDSSLADTDLAAEATKVRLSGNRITAIGKELGRYDALDTGLFICDPSLFPALDSAVAAADTTLSAGIRRLAQRGAMRAVDVAGAAWFDIDTVADLETAESQLTTPHRAPGARCVRAGVGRRGGMSAEPAKRRIVRWGRSA